MRKVMLILALALLSSCRSHKEVQRETIVDSDSVSTTVSQLSAASLDSVFSQLYFDFDTLAITVCRRTLADTTEIVRLKAVKGRVASNRSQYRQAEQAKTRLDSTAYKHHSADSSAEHTASTAVYNPPNTTAVVCISVAIALLILIAHFNLKDRK